MGDKKSFHHLTTKRDTFMRALWSDRQNCSHNVSRRFKHVMLLSDVINQLARHGLQYPIVKHTELMLSTWLCNALRKVPARTCKLQTRLNNISTTFSVVFSYVSFLTRYLTRSGKQFQTDYVMQFCPLCRCFLCACYAMQQSILIIQFGDDLATTYRSTGNSYILNPENKFLM